MLVKIWRPGARQACQITLWWPLTMASKRGFRNLSFPTWARSTVSLQATGKRRAEIIITLCKSLSPALEKSSAISLNWSPTAPPPWAAPFPLTRSNTTGPCWLAITTRATFWAEPFTKVDRRLRIALLERTPITRHCAQ